MPKFLFVYHGGDMTPPATPEAQEATMKAWGDWMASCGPALVDPGEAVKKSVTVTKSGTRDGADNAAFGYSVVEAASYDAACELAKSNPMVADGGAIEVAEINPM